MSISLKNISKLYGEQAVVDDVSLEIFPGELFVLLGASGSGKTTVLRMIAGLVSPDRGEILLQERVVNDLTPQERNVGFVFQNYSLFRHMTVAENIGFGLQIRRVDRKAREEKIHHLLELIGLPGFGHRYPSQLSGGQQQRVAVARALAYEPQVLLLDEPFGALDLKTRMQLRQSLKQIHRELGVTTVMVTHDQSDAFELGDRIGIMERGKLLATGEPSDIYKRPKSEYVAQFLGAANFFTGVMQDRHVQIGSAFLPLPEGAAAPEKGERVQVLIRPEQFEIAAGRESLRGTFLGEGEIRDCLFVGGSHRMTVHVPGVVRSMAGGFGDPDPTNLSVLMGMGQGPYPVGQGEKVVVGATSFHILPYQGLHTLVGIDGSEHGEHALQFAVYLSKKTQGRLTILGVAERFLEETKAREGLAQASQAAQKELQEVATAFRRGHPAEEILNETEQNLYDLVILGTRGRHAPSRFLGSTAARVSVNAPVPTLLTPTPFQDFKKILVCISSERVRKSDIRFVGRIARNTGASVVLFHVSPEGGEKEGFFYLQQVRQILESLGLRVETKIGEGEIVGTILKEAYEGSYDLLVLGTRIGNLREAFLTNSVTSQVLSQVDRPVLILHIRPPM
ncbi:MAG: ATP-binding cassette domain-containing protein [Candidatus Manganitrophaceae bacterium]|nr:MAG: ATP-binding cassette domain-containing protein [Candidatus Manganitrophaceae bacterium]